MGKKEKKKEEGGGRQSTTDILETLGDFTSKENWDKFFTIRGTDDSFEWYAEWGELRDPLLFSLSTASDSSSASPPQILVPGCGNSRLSELLYDSGYDDITNIDFSKVVISDMLRRNVRDRPRMRWRVMDMTALQFGDESFDVVLDKGGLDALMEPEHGPKLGNQYLSEVRRVLKSGGKFICFTLAESHVIGLLFTMFRFGWKMSVDAINRIPSGKPSLCTFMVVAEKVISSVLHPITLSFDHPSLALSGNQASGLFEVLKNENQIREEHAMGSDILYSLEDLKLGAKGDVAELSDGRRLQLTLGGTDSCFTYKAVLLDAKENTGPFSYHFGVFIVPKTRAHEWLFSSEEGQWVVVENSKAARLIMVILDSSHANVGMDEIQKDLSPLVKQLAPRKVDDGAQIPFMMASDGVKERNVVHQATSPLTGSIIVEDVVYENVDDHISHLSPSKHLIFRRLVFGRTKNLVQSEALLTSSGLSNTIVISSSSKSRKKTKQKRNSEPSIQMKVYHDYLASSYHTGIVSGLMLVSSYLETVASSGKLVNTIVIGLGAGLLPMFLHGSAPLLHIEVVELDRLIYAIARNYFGFTEDEHLKVHIADGIAFVREFKSSGPQVAMPIPGSDDGLGSGMSCSNGSCNVNHDEGPSIDILIIDVDSPDSSSGMTCPAPDFVDDSFLQAVKGALSDQGLFVVNLVSRSTTVRNMVISRMTKVFNHLFCLELEEDVNVIIFGVCSELCIEEDSFPEACLKLEKLLNIKHPQVGQSFLISAQKIKCLK